MDNPKIKLKKATITIHQEWEPSDPDDPKSVKDAEDWNAAATDEILNVKKFDLTMHRNIEKIVGEKGKVLEVKPLKPIYLYLNARLLDKD